MEIMLNSTLAGGVAIGSASDLVVTAGASMFIGCLAGIISAIGYAKLTPYLQEKIGLHDTCGVHNLHGMPGVLGGVVGAISAGGAENSFGVDLAEVFPATADGLRSASD
jgi:ammonium transporter Rh